MNRITGSIAPCAAASKTLAVISESRKSPSPGSGPVAGAVAPLSTETAAAGTGSACSNSGVTSAEIIVPPASKAANNASVRRAIAPAEAAATV